MRRLVLLILLASTAGVQAQELVVEPYLQLATPTSMWICWETSEGEESVVEWGLDDELDQRSVGHAHDGEGRNQHHEVQLSELAPATHYTYRVRTRELVSEVHHFTTPPTIDSEAPTRIVAMSDMQRDGGHPDIYRQIIEEGVIPIVRAEFGDDLSQSLSMVIVPGDLVNNGRNYAEWANTFFTPGKALMAQVPLYPVLGNHERDTQFYFDYFHLPDNGTPGFEEHWWFVDHSNVRVIGLDSNSGYRVPVQLEWLEQVLADACAVEHIDFVFAQLHHPFHSELWPAGNTAFTGDVITQLENFSTDCGKPSVHFYGHTHGYSRGHSKEHQHLMVNVATAGGNIDRWGEYAQTDYPEHTISQDEYGFVLLEVHAGDDPLFRLQRISQGQPGARRDNELRDEILIRLSNEPPIAPQPRALLGDRVNPACFTLATTPFRDENSHQATQWQISTDCADFDVPLVDRWRQSENWFNAQNTQADDDLTDEVIEDLDPDTDYCWRARFRDDGLVWSDWSIPEPFHTVDNGQIALPLLNPGAEEGIEHWQVEVGIFESINNGECSGGQPFAGQHHFAVGGVCESGELARVSQRVDISGFAVDIDAGQGYVRFGGQLRTWNGVDRPDLWVRFLADDQIISETEPVGTSLSEWSPVVAQERVPQGTRMIELVLQGQRNGGTDNDSYFDDLFMLLTMGELGCDEAPEPQSPPDAALPDAALPDAALPDAALPDGLVAPMTDMAQPNARVEESGGCQSTPGGGEYWVLIILFIRRRRLCHRDHVVSRFE